MFLQSVFMEKIIIEFLLFFELCFLLMLQFNVGLKNKDSLSDMDEA